MCCLFQGTVLAVLQMCENWAEHRDRYRRRDPSVLLYVLHRLYGTANTVWRILLINRPTRIYSYLPPVCQINLYYNPFKKAEHTLA